MFQAEQHLREISLTETYEHILSPSKRQPQALGAWEDEVDYVCCSPTKKSPMILDKLPASLINSVRLEKVTRITTTFQEACKNPERLTILTNASPNGASLFSKHSSRRKNSFQLHSLSRPPTVHQQNSGTNEDEFQDYLQLRKPVTSIVYPLYRKEGQPLSARTSKRRIDRFHSFVARTIRK